jgi:hypothetical protein
VIHPFLFCFSLDMFFSFILENIGNEGIRVMQSLQQHSITLNMFLVHMVVTSELSVPQCARSEW